MSHVIGFTTRVTLCAADPGFLCDPARAHIREAARAAYISPGSAVSAMARDGQILRNRKGVLLVADRIDLIGGRVAGHPDGHGYVSGDNGVEYVVAPREMKQVLHGDRVLVRPGGIDRRGRRRVHSRSCGRIAGSHQCIVFLRDRYA